jgi:hypothetical protein
VGFSSAQKYLHTEKIHTQSRKIAEEIFSTVKDFGSAFDNSLSSQSRQNTCQFIFSHDVIFSEDNFPVCRHNFDLCR